MAQDGEMVEQAHTPDGTANGAERPSVADTPRKRGRPKGQPKTGGRKAGVKYWTSHDIRNALLGRSEAIDCLVDIVAGRQLRCSDPTGKTVWRDHWPLFCIECSGGSEQEVRLCRPDGNPPATGEHSRVSAGAFSRSNPCR